MCVCVILCSYSDKTLLCYSGPSLLSHVNFHASSFCLLVYSLSNLVPQLKKKMHTETTRAEVARAKPAILVASTHFWAKSLISACREQVSLAAAGSTPKDLETLWAGLSCRLLLHEVEGTPTLAGCISVAAACSEAAILFSFCSLSPPLNTLYILRKKLKEMVLCGWSADNGVYLAVIWWPCCE